MRRAFLTVTLLFALAPMFLSTLHAHVSAVAALEGSRNAIALRQQLADAAYELEHGFKNAVREQLEEIDPAKTPADQRSGIICSGVSRLRQMVVEKYGGSLKSFYVSPSSYKPQSKEKSCEESIQVFTPLDGHAVLCAKVNEVNGKDIGQRMQGNRRAFVFNASLAGIGFRFLIPEGTEVCR